MVAAFSHAVLFIASFFATPIGVAHAPMSTDLCHGGNLVMQVAQPAYASAWQPVSSEVTVRAYAPVQRREVALMRVLGRCVVKNAPEDAHRVLYVLFGSDLDNSDNQDAAAVCTVIKRSFAHPAVLTLGRADLPALLASETLLERPPRA